MLEDILKQSSAAEVLADLIKPDLEAQIKAELAPQIKAELAPQIKAELAPQIKAELEPQIKAELAGEIARHLVRAALEGKFGALDEEMAAALKSADVAVLEAIISHITSESQEQVRARLGLG